MLIFFVLEVVVNPLLFHEPADEVEIRLAVLHAVSPGPVGSIEGFFEIREAVIAEDLLDDVGDFLLLKDPAIGGPRQEP